MHRPWPSTLLALMLGVVALTGVAAQLGRSTTEVAGATAPEFPALPASAWINSAPLTLSALRGHPVLIWFWTFDCVNCRNTLPWVKQIQARYAHRGLALIAVHSPELPHERDPLAVAAHVKSLDMTWPVMLDTDFAYWTALGNRFWPAFYLIDGDGRIVDRRIGELHEGDTGADDFERSIARLAGARAR
jgi:thiol-disulfide isomerase/thioredoxin